MPGSGQERGKCHRLPMEDTVEAFWGGVTPSTVVSGDAGVGRVRDGSHGDLRMAVFLASYSLPVFFAFLCFSFSVVPFHVVIAGTTHSVSI